jgi:arsenate reductase
MAEAIVNTHFGDEWEAVSAGTYPTGFVHPKAIMVLNEIGITHKGRSKNVNEYRVVPFDLVVTVCDSAAEECPIWLGSGRRVHASFPDPAKVNGSEEDKLTAFRQVRDAMVEKIPHLLNLTRCTE